MQNVFRLNKMHAGCQLRVSTSESADAKYVGGRGFTGPMYRVKIKIGLFTEEHLSEIGR